jgi:hypothetical protein
MLYFSTALDKVKLEYGQLLIPFESLKLDEDKLEKIFINTVKKLQNKRPIRTTKYINVDSNGTKLADALSVLALKYKVYENFDRIAPPISRNQWWFDPATKILVTAFSSPFIVVYLKEYTLGHFLIQEKPTSTVDGEDEIYFFIKEIPKKGTIKITKGTSIAEETSRDANVIHVSGTLGTGTIDIKNLKGVMTLTDTTAGDISLEYTNKRKAVKEIEEQDSLFHLMFTLDVMRSYGSLKYQATMSQETGLPFSLQSDTLLERVRQLEDTLNEQLRNNNFWWNFGF